MVSQCKDSVEDHRRDGTDPPSGFPGTGTQSRFVNSASINGGIKFLKQHAGILAKAEERFGVPAEIIVAIIGIETRYGKVLGSLRVLDSLVTLSVEYPRRSKFFSSELEHFVQLSAEQGLDPLSVKDPTLELWDTPVYAQQLPQLCRRL